MSINNALWSEIPNSKFIVIAGNWDLIFDVKMLSMQENVECVILVGQVKLILNPYWFKTERKSNFCMGWLQSSKIFTLKSPAT